MLGEVSFFFFTQVHPEKLKRAEDTTRDLQVGMVQLCWGRGQNPAVKDQGSIWFSASANGPDSRHVPACA
jgi:hypothetical protein